VTTITTTIIITKDEQQWPLVERTQGTDMIAYCTGGGWSPTSPAAGLSVMSRIARPVA